MSRSSRLRVADVQALHHLAEECRDLGDAPGVWRLRLATHLGRLVGAGFVTVGDMPVRSGQPVGFLSDGEYGWDNGFPRAGFDHLQEGFAAYGMRLCPLIEPYARVRQQNDSVALSRADLVPDADWFPTQYHREYHSHTGSEHLLYCFRDLPHVAGHWCALTLTRAAGERDFSPRQKAIVAEVNRLVAPLVGGALAGFTEPSPAELAPRVRAVLACLLEGDSDKQVAARLRLSVFTVNQYVKLIFNHFNVNSRPELLARWIKRGWGSQGGWRPNV